MLYLNNKIKPECYDFSSLNSVNRGIELKILTHWINGDLFITQCTSVTDKIPSIKVH